MAIEQRICRCVRCSYEWVKRIGGDPTYCPNCKQRNWNIPVGELPIGRPKKVVAKRKK